MALYGDYHTHTRYSHGKGTIEDNVLAAIEAGLSEVAITDHGFRHGAYHVRKHHWPLMKKEATQIKAKYPDLKIYLGLETNLISTDGSIDVDEEDLNDLDILVCGYHKYVRAKRFKDYFRFWLPNFFLSTFNKSTKKQRKINTDAYVKSIERNNIDILSHPLRGLDADIAEIARAAHHFGTFLELNGKNVELTRQDIDTALNEGAEFIVSSDAHHPQRVGVCSKPFKVIDEYQIPHSSIVNWDKQPSFRSVRAKTEGKK